MIRFVDSQVKAYFPSTHLESWTICKNRNLLYLGTNDETGTLSAMASLTYLTADQLLSGDFVKCAPGIIGVSGSFKNLLIPFEHYKEMKIF